VIIKHVPMRSVRKSDFAGLVQYITNEQGKTERVGICSTTNCTAETMDAVISEVLAIQRLNTRATGDKTYHLLVSFRPGENPDPTMLKAIEERICLGLGYSEHQRVSVVHHDTDNIHLHIAINKIHPIKRTMHESYKAYRSFAKLCKVLEKDYELKPDNHVTRKSVSEGRAIDMERHSGIESLMSWIRRECLGKIREAQSWDILHQVLHENGLELLERGNGFVFKANDGTMVKASTVARDISKTQLEKRLGPFEKSNKNPRKTKREYRKQPVRMRVDTTELFARFKKETQGLEATKSSELGKMRSRKKRKIDAAKRSNRLHRATIKMMKGRIVKKLLYAKAHKKLLSEIDLINRHYNKEHLRIKAQYQRRTWADWLKWKALEGDSEALAALRSREAAQGLKGNTIRGEGQPNPLPGRVAIIDNITKKGTIIIRAGQSAVRDDGNKLQVSRELASEGLQEAMQLAIEQYGNRITINGTNKFKEQVVRVAASAKLPLSFTDPIIENWRQQLIMKENVYTRQHYRKQIDHRSHSR
jgi:hypothetical protein